MRIVFIEVSHWHTGMHYRSFQLAGVEVVGVSDQDAKTASTWGERMLCPWWTDYREMMEDTKPDFVVALGRPADMPAIARFLLGSGLPFAIEKPVGISQNDLAPLVEMATERDAFVAIPLVRRYSPLWETLENLEAEGRAGKYMHAHFRVINGPPERYRSDGVPWMLNPDIAGGGCMRNLGIHAVDAFLSFVRSEPVEVLSSAVSYGVYGEPVEEFTAALLRSESGIIGTLEAGYSYAAMKGGDSEWRIATENSYIIERDEVLKTTTLDDGQKKEISIAGKVRASRYDLFGPDTIQRLQAGIPPIASLEDCYRAMQVIDQIYEKAIPTMFGGIL
jgi:predicted dehydrogenase